MTDTMAQNKVNKSFTRKSGRTLLVKFLNDNVDFEDIQLEGLLNNHFIEKSTSYFLTFDNVDHSLSAMHFIRNKYDSNVRVKFAHYRVFFTLENLEESMDYNTIKTEHKNLIESKGNFSVLYYKLYRKEIDILDVVI